MSTKSLLHSIVLCAVVALPASIICFHVLTTIDAGLVELDFLSRLSSISFWIMLLPWYVAFFVTCMITIRLALNCKRINSRDDYDDEGDSSPHVSGPREIGTVKWFNGKKGFGFITREDGEDIFVHHRSIRVSGRGRRFLNEGQKVEYTVTHKGKGPQAEDVVIL